MIVCTGEFTAPAIAFAEANNIELVNGDRLERLVNQVQDKAEPESTQTATPSASTESIPPANRSLPDCPRCAAPMVERIAKKGPNTGKHFLGCSGYPRCRGTREAAA